MGFSRFRLIVIIRILLIAATCAGIAWIFRHPEPMITVGLVLILTAAVQVVGLIHYVETMTRDMTRFLQAVKSDDFTQNFDRHGWGQPMEELGQALKDVSDSFRSVRAEKEGHYHYIQSVIRQVGTGLVSFNENGDVRLINNAARQLLGITQLRNMDQLHHLSPGFGDMLLQLEPGDRELIHVNGRELSVYATGFTLQGERFLTVSLQDIGHELDNERMRNELELAHKVQQQLFPTCPPNREGLDICGHCIPARETGGDYYDWLDSGKDRLGLVIGDVSGKGMAAAFYMTLCKGFFQSFAGSSLEPGDITAQVNDMLARTMEKNRFVSVFLGMIDPGRRSLTYCRAGHNPPILFRNGQAEPVNLDARGIALGVETGERFSDIQQQASLQLEENDILVCYTDGITEAMDENGNQYGTDRVTDVVRAHRAGSAADILNAIFEDVQQFTGQSCPEDDMTLIVMRVGDDS